MFTATAKTKINGKIYRGIAIGASRIEAEKEAIRNMIQKIPEFKYFWN